MTYTERREDHSTKREARYIMCFPANDPIRILPSDNLPTQSTNQAILNYRDRIPLP